MELRNKNGKIKTGYVVAGVVALGAAGFGIYKLTKKKTDSSEKLLEEIVKNIDPKQTTISTTQAKEIAERLYTAMKGVGTDSKEIEELIITRNLTSSDILLVASAFGVRKYGTFGSPAFDWMGGTDLDLMGWLRRELSGSLLEKIELKFRQAGFVAGLKGMNPANSYAEDVARYESTLSWQLEKTPCY